jgi:DNA polymerase-4
MLHLDLDAFFCAVEQRDKPSLRGRPVVVGGTGGRGVVATASYEARAFGVRSAMPVGEARRRAPAGTAFLAGRFPAYRKSSAVVMEVLREVSALVEQVSIDEAFIDIAGVEGLDLSPEGVRALAQEITDAIRDATGGLTASVGAGSSKLMAKIGSDLKKPSGITVVPAGAEMDILGPLPVGKIPGVGPATQTRLATYNVRTVADLARMSLDDLVVLFGAAHGNGLFRAARAQDDRPVVISREAKSVSAEDTFATDITALPRLHAEVDRLAGRVQERLRSAASSGRTVTLKVRLYDFSTVTRSATLQQPVDDARVVAATAKRLLGEVSLDGGVRLLGVGVSGLTDFVQDDLFAPTGTADDNGLDAPEDSMTDEQPQATPSGQRSWAPGADVVHADRGPGWVWGSGLGRVTVRFEGPTTGPGKVATFRADDPALAPADPPDWA